MGLWRFIKVMRNIRDDYTGTVHCKKPLNETIEFIKSYMGKGSKNTGKNYHGEFKVVADKDWNTWYEIIKEVQTIQAISGRITDVPERMRFKVMHYGGVVNNIQLEIHSTDSKVCFEEFEKDFSERVADVKGPVQVPPPAADELGDLSGKKLIELLDIFEKAAKKFGADASKPLYDNVKKVRAELGKRVDDMDIKARAPYNQSLSKIDTFLSAIDMQFSNPAMAANVKTFAGNYVSQMLAEISQMVSITD